MEPVVTPTVTVTFSVDLELKYDPFKGKSPMEFAVSVEDDLVDTLIELRPEVLGVFTSIVSVEEHDRV
jgi:hypothetical protein